MKNRPVAFLIAVFFVLMTASTVVYSQTSDAPGMTGLETYLPYYHTETLLATPLLRNQADTGSMDMSALFQDNLQLMEEEDWVLINSQDYNFSVPPGEHYAFRFDPTVSSLESNPPVTNFSDICNEAIDRAPSWLRNDLIDMLLQYSDLGFLQDIIAEQILNTEDPYVDEVAYILAHLSPELLISGRMSWDLTLVLENVQDVYAADEVLDYVRINDHGTSSDDDYWSTTEYAIRAADGDTIQVEIDRELYYMFIVHPRITDEIPSYINPETGSAAAPPTGRFWREFILNHADEGYTPLCDYLEDCGIMYGNIFNNNTDDNGAIGIITRYIQDIMDFGSGSERPIQPVRIYALHLGRCGEHQDITAAAGRAALIPVAGTTAITEDHVWDEFWDGFQWTQWEPVNNYVNHPLSYQGWGKQFPALFDWRSDGWVWTVTERYHTNTTTLEVVITDVNENPVDGAQIRVISEYLYGGMQLASCGYTDSEGRIVFTIGGGRNIYLNVQCDLGNYPGTGNNGVLAVEESDTDYEYSWSYSYPEAMDIVQCGEATEPPEPTNHYQLSFDYEKINEATYNQIFTDADFVAVMGEGVLDFFVCDQENYDLFANGEEFEAFAAEEIAGEGSLEFTCPTDETWYAVFDNSNSLANYQRISLSAGLFVDENWQDVGENPELPSEFTLIGAYPNPFNSATNVRFALSKQGRTEISIYNINGQLVERYVLGQLSAGLHSVNLNLDGLASGTYLYNLQSGTSVASGRLVLLK